MIIDETEETMFLNWRFKELRSEVFKISFEAFYYCNSSVGNATCKVQKEITVQYNTDK